MSADGENNGSTFGSSEFNKTFSLRTGWPLPYVENMFVELKWQLNELQDIKTSLNKTKQKLNSFDLNQWHTHTSKMNPAGLVIDHVRKHVRPDFLTQAWCKFYELACNSPSFLPQDLIVDNERALCTVHLCEAPGAFVSSLNHYMALNHHNRPQFQWLAMTLNPYHEANGRPDIVSDDRLILNTLDHWEFGPDYTGDIFQDGYSDHLRQTVRQWFGQDACLVTADGSIDCSDDPGEQETVVMRLHHHECMVALNVLRDGGSLLLKMFTAFECGTVCRMYLLCCLFQSVVFRKPATSKPGNSEVYALCTGYVGRSVALPYIHKFFEVGDSSAAMFPLSEIPKGFRTEVFKCSEYFSNMQIQTIETNINAWSQNNRLRWYRDMETLQWSVCQEFVNRYGLRPIQRDQELMSVNRFKLRIWTNSGRRHGMSYLEKTRLRHLDQRQQADMLYQEVMRCDEWKKPRLRDVFWGKHEHLNVKLSDVRFRLGKPVVSIKGSKFCSESLVHYRLQVLSKFPHVKSKEDADSRSLYYRFKLDRPKMSVCDLTEICAEHRADNNAQQYHCLKALTSVLRSLTTSSDFLLIGYPLYTQMAVACFFAVASLFGTYGLMKPDLDYGHAFLFFSYTFNDGWLNALEEAKGFLLPEANSNFALVSWMPIKILLEQSAYSDIVTINNLCIVQEIEPILSSFLNSFTTNSEVQN